MPNWCDNYVTFTGESESLNALRIAFEKGKLFETFLPTEDRTSEWGTKWDVGINDGDVTQEEGILTLTFMSAWSPPIEFYQFIGTHLSVHVSAQYIEMGNAFYGYFDTITFENTTSYSSFKEIPEDIVDTFGLEDYEESFKTWVRPKVPSKKNGRKGTRKGWERRNPPRWIDFETIPQRKSFI